MFIDIYTCTYVNLMLLRHLTFNFLSYFGQITQFTETESIFSNSNCIGLLELSDNALFKTIR